MDYRTQTPAPNQTIPPNSPFNRAYYGVPNQPAPSQTYFAPPQPVQPMTPPVRYVDIIIVENEQAMRNYEIARGTTQAFMDRESKLFGLKTVYVNGEVEFVFYDRRLPAPQEQPPAYVTAAELDEKLNNLLEAITTNGGKDGSKNGNV